MTLHPRRLIRDYEAYEYGFSAAYLSLPPKSPMFSTCDYVSGYVDGAIYRELLLVSGIPVRLFTGQQT